MEVGSPCIGPLQVPTGGLQATQFRSTPETS